jgi:hypothetical protein
MAIKRKVPDNRPHAPPSSTRDVTVPSFSYPSTNGLAQVIIDVWANPGHIMDRDNKGNPTQTAVREATQKIQSTAQLDLERAVIITEQEHDDDYTQQTMKSFLCCRTKTGSLITLLTFSTLSNYLWPVRRTASSGVAPLSGTPIQ